RKYIEIIAPGIIVIKAHAAVALDTSIHFMVEERPQILIFVGSFFEAVTAVIVARHNRHILEVAFSAFVADRAVMGGVDHQGFDIAVSESAGFFLGSRDACATIGGGHAGPAGFCFAIVFV